MKLKTLVKLNEIKEEPAKMFIHTENDAEFEMGVMDYLAWKDFEIIDWFYICGDPSENTEDKIIVYI